MTDTVTDLQQRARTGPFLVVLNGRSGHSDTDAMCARIKAVFDAAGRVHEFLIVEPRQLQAAATKAVQLAQRDFTPTFTVAQMIKDLGLILGEGAASHVPLPQTAATLQLMQAAMAQGDGAEDYAAIIKTVERAAGNLDAALIAAVEAKALVGADDAHHIVLRVVVGQLVGAIDQHHRLIRRRQVRAAQRQRRRRGTSASGSRITHTHTHTHT